METKFQTSFIPHTPAEQGGSQPAAMIAPGPREGDGMMHFVTRLIFGIMFIATVSLFAAEFFLNRSIAAMGSSLSIARAEIAPSDRITNLNRAHRRIMAAEELLGGHVEVSSVFEMLQVLTVRTVMFDSFDYSSLRGNQISLSMQGRAAGFTAIAQQAAVFDGQPYIINPMFSDFSLNEDGSIAFSFRATLDQSLIYGSGQGSQ